MTSDDLLDQFKDMTLLELSEFIKKFEEAFDVQAAAPMAIGVAPGAAVPGAAAPAEEVEEQTEFDVVLTGAGDKKIQVIKEVRALTSLGLKEAKDLVDSAPKPVLERVPKEQADAAKEKLEGAGGAGPFDGGPRARPVENPPSRRSGPVTNPHPSDTIREPNP